MEFISGDPNVLYSCYFIIFFFYALLLFSIEASNLYLGLILIVSPLLLYFGIKTISLPKPPECRVKDVLGVDIWYQHKEKLFNHNIDKESSQEPVFRTIAHRAAALDAPENSISALKYCKLKGCPIIEIDLSLTKDNVPIVFHDATLDRMVGVSGKVSDYLWDELKDFDLIFRTNDKRKNFYCCEKIPLFDEFMNLCVELGVRVFIDIKDKSDEVVKVVLQTYQKHPSLYKTSVISSFNPIILYKIRKINPNIMCSMAWRPQHFSRKQYNPVISGERRHSSFLVHVSAVMFDVFSTWMFMNFTYHVVGVSAVLLHKNAISPGMVATWQRRKVRVIAWTVNSKIEKDYFARILHIPYMTDSLDYNHLPGSSDTN